MLCQLRPVAASWCFQFRFQTQVLLHGMATMSHHIHILIGKYTHEGKLCFASCSLHILKAMQITTSQNYALPVAASCGQVVFHNSVSNPALCLQDLLSSIAIRTSHRHILTEMPC